jgi:hypothetical protein
MSFIGEERLLKRGVFAIYSPWVCALIALYQYVHSRHGLVDLFLFLEGHWLLNQKRFSNKTCFKHISRYVFVCNTTLKRIFDFVEE